MEEFTKEYVLMWKNWSDFEGKSNLREFWMAVLINFIIGIIFTALGQIAGIFTAVAGLYNLAIIIPFIALAIRRMHDVGRTGWYVLWLLLPIIGWIIFILAAIQPSK